MDKVVFRFDTEFYRDEKIEDSIWYYLDAEYNKDPIVAAINPWNKEDVVTQKKMYLMDDCVISIRPARMEDRISRRRDEPVTDYFIEIQNQDGSIKFSSRRIYSWEKVIEYASWFKGLSFTAATRVWKVKKL